jgi:hypothetical protein
MIIRIYYMLHFQKRCSDKIIQQILFKYPLSALRYCDEEAYALHQSINFNRTESIVLQLIRLFPNAADFHVMGMMVIHYKQHVIKNIQQKLY